MYYIAHWGRGSVLKILLRKIRVIEYLIHRRKLVAEKNKRNQQKNSNK